MPNILRDEEIGKLWLAGHSFADIGKQYGMTREGARQIVKKLGLKKEDRQPVERSSRDEFLGVNVSESTKSALKAEADRRGVSMSLLTSETIENMLHDIGELEEK